MAIRMVLTFHDNGRLEIECPADKVASVGLLEIAKHAVLSKPAQPMVQPVSIIPDLGAGLNGKRG